MSDINFNTFIVLTVPRRSDSSSSMLSSIVFAMAECRPITPMARRFCSSVSLSIRSATV
uniref:Uncharacterized protein n=1 Tax=Spodoptera exigua multiple nucleopolyhedrovirus TaxID=10454 RepID=A0A6N0C355_9ABAC|nr:hypothetical protein [Spodoptera exigua multiple nucleopolyhedrovirus]